MKWKKVSKEQLVKSIRKINNYIEIRKEGYIRLLQNEEIIFESRFENSSPRIWEIRNNYIYIGNYPSLQVFDLSKNDLVKSINVKTETEYGSYRFYKENLLFIERNYPDELAYLIYKDANDFSVTWRINDIEVHLGYLYMNDNFMLICNKDFSLINCIDLEKGRNSWHFDIGQFGPYREWDFIKKQWEEKRREIYRVYYHRGKIIATLSRAIIALDPEDGHLIWKIDFEDISPVELVFDGNIAYLGELLHFLIIDIEEGKVLFHRYDPTYKIEIEGYILSQITYHGLSLYRNYLWLARNISGREFLLKINPQNGEIVDGMLLDTNYSCHPPIFQGDRMYILDQVGDLYVYEEVSEGAEKAEEEEEEVYIQALDIKGKKHILVYTEKWCRELEDKLESYMIHYWVKGSIKESDDVRFVFQRTEGINADTLYGEMIKFLDCDRIRAVLASIPAANVKALVGEEVHPEYQPYYLVNFFKNKENFSKMFGIKD